MEVMTTKHTSEGRWRKRCAGKLAESERQSRSICTEEAARDTEKEGASIVSPLIPSLVCWTLNWILSCLTIKGTK